ncbi:MAG TPA: response regulator transcription factor [Solirubrobacteraceae bacterium]|nr:response regulator transcription factor [Solirubrobacteraceae bacterium]
MTNRDRFTLLLIDDDDAARTFLADNLTADGYDLLVADGAPDGLRLLASKYPDLALVDAGLPGGAALDLVSHVREADGIASRIDPQIPLILHGARADELDRVRGFERGADDVLATPFSYAELRCRVEALLRRATRRHGAGRLRVADLEIDTAARSAHLGGAPLDLSAKEFALLRVLAADPTRVFTKAELLRSIWGQRAVGTTRTLDSHACRLRRKLGARGGRFVINVWGVGYRLVDAPAPAAVEIGAVAA